MERTRASCRLCLAPMTEGVPAGVLRRVHAGTDRHKCSHHQGRPNQDEQ